MGRNGLRHSTVTGDGLGGDGTWMRSSAAVDRSVSCIMQLISADKSSIFYCGTSGTAPVQKPASVAL